MYVRTNKKLLLAAAVVIMLNFSSCSKYEDGPAFSLKTKTARLSGDWEVVEINNNASTGMTLEFEKDGDFSLDVDYGYGYNYSYDGEWEWESGKESVEIDITGTTMEWDILRLTDDELWFEDENGQEWKCEKE